jgi:hypothetical protein
VSGLINLTTTFGWQVVDSEEWTLQLGDNFAKHLAVYSTDSELKRSCFKQLGLVLQKLTKKDYIHTKLQEMFTTCQVRFTSCHVSLL